MSSPAGSRDSSPRDPLTLRRGAIAAALASALLLVTSLLPAGAPAGALTAFAEDGPSPAQPPDRPAVRFLPDWVQVPLAGRLYAGDADGAAVVASLPRFAFLRVLSAGKQRLLVQWAGDTEQSGSRGWVAPEAVQPSEPGEGWLLNHRATPLLASAEATAAPSRQLDQWTYLRQRGAPVLGRVPVRLYHVEFRGPLAEGWVKTEDVGPIGPPTASVPSAEPGPPPRSAAVGDGQGFIEAVAAAARPAKAETGVPIAVTVAQAILESAWGDSLLSRTANNFFGVKALGGLGTAGVVWMRTLEYDPSGQPHQALAPFRAYTSLAESVVDHDRLFARLARYRPAMQASDDAREFARRIAAGGYATDPAYADKLIALMDRYDLYRYDG